MSFPAKVAARFTVEEDNPNEGDEDYLMDHSTFTYLAAPEVGFLEVFRRETTPEQMADRVQCFAERL